MVVLKGSLSNTTHINAYKMLVAYKPDFIGHICNSVIILQIVPSSPNHRMTNPNFRRILISSTTLLQALL